jgi:hypothetical protein
MSGQTNLHNHGRGNGCLVEIILAQSVVICNIINIGLYPLFVIITMTNILVSPVTRTNQPTNRRVRARAYTT